MGTLKVLLQGQGHPGLCPICGPTVFQIRGPWLRDEYVCRRCGSIPRQRALVQVLRRTFPDWASKIIFESSPSGPGSALIQRRCARYTPSQFFADVSSGEFVNGIRREDLRALSLPDQSVDIVITQDVFEHVVNPSPAFAEIARVLRPGGAHVFTVPIFDSPTTKIRVADDGTHLMEADYHKSPIGDRRALVAREWGTDIVQFIRAACGLETERFDPTSWRHGLRGAMKDVLVSRKR